MIQSSGRKMRRVVGVVPAAGYARRLGKLALSKEMLPVRGRPIMDHIIERMRIGGADAVRVITRAAKADVTKRANELGAEVICCDTQSPSESIAVGTAGLHHDSVVLIGYPDTTWEPADGYRRLLADVGTHWQVVLGLFGGADLERSDVATIDDNGRVIDIAVKPHAPRGTLIWGCACATVRALSGIDSFADIGYFWSRLCRDGRVAGIHLSDDYADIGTRAALAATIAENARQEPEPESRS
jgi:NDP-sugar pyrophosphorylase family protein